MCGITGYWTPEGKNAEVLTNITRAMGATIDHRGPDSNGEWVEAKHGIALAHRRLSIIDLSEAGNQPMQSPCGRYVICYNGEVYNFRELREKLRNNGHTFKGGSDTEVILTAIVQWGLKKAVEHFIGMFAFALWDTREATLSLVRDRLGIKPLFYGTAGKAFVFGSELKPLLKAPDFIKEVDRDGLVHFFKNSYIPAPQTIYTSAKELLPGSILKLRSPTAEPHISKYWSTSDVWNNGFAHPFTGDFQTASHELEHLLSKAVKQRMVADVPLGAFLSGGIDSSLVVALMQKQSENPVKTFSIGFDVDAFNEAPYAKSIARHLKTNHTELIASSKDMLEIIPNLSKHWDEPFSDTSQLPTLLVSQMTKENVTVALSGDGGDELFAGYSRYFWLNRLESALQSIPHPLRSLGKTILESIPAGLMPLLPGVAQKIVWRAGLLDARNKETRYSLFMSHAPPLHPLVLGHQHSSSENDSARSSLPFISQMELWDLLSYLPGDILTKTDRASMAASLELRIPILDHRIVQFASSIPLEWKTDGKHGKIILKDILKRHVPEALFERPKKGFAIPLNTWLRQDLRPWVEDMLNSNTISQQGLLDDKAVQAIKTKFYAGEEMYGHTLWDIASFQSWHEEYMH